MRPTTLYCLTCRPTGRIYVGITSAHMNRRWSEHVRKSRAPKYPINFAIRKHGADNFSVDVLFVYPTRSEAAAAEETVVDVLSLCTVGYNAAAGGDRGPTVGTKRPPFSVEWRQKLSASGRGKKKPRKPEHTEKIAQQLRGRARSLTDEQREGYRSRMIAANKRRAGVPLTSSHRAKLSAAHRRHPLLQELHV